MPLKQAKPTARKAPARTRRVTEASSTPRPSRPSVMERPSSAVPPGGKRALILAHEAMRRTRDPVQLASLWMGVVATFAVVVGCWAWAFTPSMIKAVKAPMPELDSIAQTVKETQKSMNAVISNQAVKDQALKATEQLQALSDQAQARQQALDRIAQTLSATSTESDTSTTTRDQLFHAPPAAAVTPSSTTSTH